MKRYIIQFATAARDAIQSHVDFVAIDLRSRENAERWLHRLLLSVASLEEMPTRFTRDQTESDSVGVDVYRLTFERSCVLFYVVDEDVHRVRILSFRYGGRP